MSLNVDITPDLDDEEEVQERNEDDEEGGVLLPVLRQNANFTITLASETGPKNHSFGVERRASIEIVCSLCSDYFAHNVRVGLIASKRSCQLDKCWENGSIPACAVAFSLAIMIRRALLK